MNWKHGILGLVALVLWAGCGSDDSTGSGEPVNPIDINGALVVPAAWAGTWEITLTFRDSALMIRSHSPRSSLVKVAVAPAGSAKLDSTSSSS